MEYVGGIVGYIDERAPGTATVTNCLYGGACRVSAAKPEGIGEVVATFASYEGAPGLTAYTGGLLYDGKYYTPSSGGEAPEYTAADVIRLVNIIAGKEPYAADADLNKDGKVTIADVIAMINVTD